MTESGGREGFLAVLIAAGAIGLALLSGPTSSAAPVREVPSAGDAVAKGAATAPLPTGSGSSTYLLKLAPAPTMRVFRRNRDDGLGAARAAARDQRERVAGAQAEAVEDLPTSASVLFRTHSVISAIAVQSDADDLGQLEDIPGVTAVYPVAPKERTNASAVPLQGAPAVWGLPGGNTGEGIKIAIVDSGIDYTHADFGGPGTAAAWEYAHTHETDPPAYGSSKVIGGYDFVGDTYTLSPDPGPVQPVAHPDDNPIDCGAHGTHVAGSAAGFGVNADGSTYSGDYDEDTDFGAMKIGPGMAPGADLLAYKVFGCSGNSTWITAGINKAADPNGDGDPSDGADVINLSLGSDYGSVEDGDSIAANAAAEMGMSVVAAAGNSGDSAEVSGSPGDASRVISVANSQDASDVIDGTGVEIDGVSGNYGSSRSGLYDWEGDPDLSGTVVRPPSDNLFGCDPYAPGTFSGQVVLVDWDDTDVRCGTIALSGNLEAGGAGGFILGSNSETFSAGINGSETIPGVIMVASGAGTLRAALAANQGVEVVGTSVNSVVQNFPENVDRITPSAARGLHAIGNVKPDVSAVGGSIFSAAMGAATEGSTKSGTSMASPMVAGLAALLHEAKPNWTPLQVKADIMNTATHDLTVNGALGPAGDVFSPVRVGAGRIDAAQAVNNEVLAYNAERGAVSVSFGPLEVDGPVTLSKPVTVQNTGASTVTYEASYDEITSVPGAEYSVSPAEVTVAPGESVTVDVTLSIADPDELTKTVDPTAGRESAELGLPRETLAEAAGRLLLDPAVTGPTLRVPVYAAPRPVADMGQADSVRFNGGGTKLAELELEGSDLGQDGANGTGNTDPADDIFSLASGFELTATSGLSPNCGGEITQNCIRLPGERSGDVKYVGFTSSHPYRGASESRGYFAISTHAPYSIPASKFKFQVEIDVDDDRRADLYLINNRLVSGNGQPQDVFVAQMLDSNKEEIGDPIGINGRFGDIDTALFDTDTMVLPFSTQLLAEYGVDPGHPRINYGISAYSSFTESSKKAIDLVGIDPDDGDLELSVDLFEPAIQVGADKEDAPRLDDVDGETVTITGDTDSFENDRGQGVLMVHFHNRAGDKAQVVDIDRGSQTIVSPWNPGSAVAGTSSTINATGGGSGKPVTFSSATPNACAVTGAAVRFIAAGTCTIYLEQEGDAFYRPAPPVTRSVTVARAAGPIISARVSSAKPKNSRGWFRTPVTVTFTCQPGGAPLAGKCPAPVTLRKDGAPQSVRRMVSSTDGASDSVRVGGLKIDRTRPTIRIRGVLPGNRYRRAPRGRCVARDKTSKVASCRLERRQRGKKLSYTAVARDKAGNSRTLKVRARTKT